MAGGALQREGYELREIDIRELDLRELDSRELDLKETPVLREVERSLGTHGHAKSYAISREVSAGLERSA